MVKPYSISDARCNLQKPSFSPANATDVRKHKDAFIVQNLTNGSAPNASK